MKELKVKFRGVDDFDRPIYKLEGGNVYLGSINILVGSKELPFKDKLSINGYFKNNTDKLELFGSTFNCEPMGGRSSKWNIKIID